MPINESPQKEELSSSYVLLGSLLFLSALVMIFFITPFIKWCNALIESLPYISRPQNIGLGHLIVMPILGLVMGFPGIGGPIAFSHWGRKLKLFRILLAGLILAFLFTVGQTIHFDKNQWVMLDVILVGQLIAMGYSVPRSIPWGWVVFLCLIFVTILIPTYLYILDYVIAVYLFIASFLILFKKWEFGKDNT